jgi:hypothetical protein
MMMINNRSETQFYNMINQEVMDKEKMREIEER